MPDRAPITPAVLQWARRTAKISVDTAAAKVGVSTERLSEWEIGASQPTMVQAETLAKFYKRPFSLFFLPDIPRDFTPLKDFRKNAPELSTASLFIIREIQERQAWISDFYQENGEDPLPFVGKFTITDAIDKVAKDIRDTLGISPPEYQTGNPVKEWVDKAESKGIFVSRSSFIHSRMKFDSDEMKGFAIVDGYAPFIFINTEDWRAPQLFTLVHELVHIWIGVSAVSNESDFQLRLRGELHEVERFCNEVAAMVLMPKDNMLSLPRSVFRSSNDVFAIAKSWGVSSFALLVRALFMGLINHAEYNTLKEQAEIAFRAYVKKEEERRKREKGKENGPSYYLLQLNKVSRLFTENVLQAYRSGEIPPTQASNLLNVPTNNFSKLEKFIYP
ncbi:XRE family transcriptional regulator [Spirosoma panaciterrae]|uniref:XRE family transcriptional regulator n=1 Tax=Spirosoma panaciterrae TaxID=496058 RepID=UPI0003718F0F|nr:XRE family transcriptional regulator [Spirosoma panaciterrae]